MEMLEGAAMELALGTQYLASRTPCEIVPGIELEATCWDHLAWPGFCLGRNDASDRPIFQRAKNLGVCIAGVYCCGPDRAARRRGDCIKSLGDCPTLIFLPVVTSTLTMTPAKSSTAVCCL